MANCEFPEEIVTNILKRLPVKSLMRFQCVSPAWLDLIKSPFFRNMHIKHQKLLKNNSSCGKSKEEKEDEYIVVLRSPRTEKGNPEFVFYTRGDAGELIPKPAPSNFPVFPHPKMELCAPCNGIFCVVTKIEDEVVYLCNPAIRELRRLPDRPFGFQPEKFPDSGVSYVLRAAWGWGLDPRTDECKFVSVMYYGTPGDRYYFDSSEGYDLFDSMVAMYPFGVINHGIIQFEIFDLGSNTWREVDVELPPNVLGLAKRKRNQSYVYTLDEWRGSGMFLNGCIHWRYNAYLDHSILCFDISSEKMRAFEVPFSPDKRDSLVVLGNSLAMVHAERVANSPISIWVMEEYGSDESWVKRFCLDPYTTFLHPLISWKDDGGDLLLFQANDPEDMETLVSCNTSGNGYHTYPICAVREPYLVLRAIVISDQTFVSVM